MRSYEHPQLGGAPITILGPNEQPFYPELDSPNQIISDHTDLDFEPDYETIEELVIARQAWEALTRKISAEKKLVL